jgi:uncharacterized membrane protein YphA (DoxX/SURF4 family)
LAGVEVGLEAQQQLAELFPLVVVKAGEQFVLGGALGSGGGGEVPNARYTYDQTTGTPAEEGEQATAQRKPYPRPARPAGRRHHRLLAPHGFLASVEVRPFQSFFHAIAGTWWANGLFMLGLLAIGVALIAGVAMRIAAISGVLMLAMMWLAEVPFAQFTSAGEPTGSPNPFADSHYTYAIVLIVLAATYAGTTWGLGATWARLPFVHHNR